MSSDDHIKLNCIDAQQLSCTLNKMATITSSAVTNNTIQNSITEHVLNNELTNFVNNNKLNLDKSNNHIDNFNQNQSNDNVSINLKNDFDLNDLNSNLDNSLNQNTNCLSTDLVDSSKSVEQSSNSDGKREDVKYGTMTNKFNNNNNVQCVIKECNQFNLNHNKISKLTTDDYLSEHDFTKHLISNNQFNIKMNQQFNPHPSVDDDREEEEKNDEDDEIYCDAPDSDLDQHLNKEQSNDELIKQSNKKLSKSNYVDIETMKNHLAKLKLSKDFDNFTNNNSPLDEFNDDNDYFDAIDEEIERGPLIRSTSLKTGKFNNLEPENKKMVRFADAMGLDLAKIKKISQEDLPNVPASAFRDLKMCKKEVKGEFFNNQLSCSPVRSSPLNQPFNYWNQPGRTNSIFNKAPILSNGVISTGSCVATNGNWPILMPEFVQPFTQYNFLERVRNQKVCLESCVVSSIGNNLSIDCLIRVQNISFDKSIMVRYTSNNWATWLDSLASYIPNSCDGQTDKFSVKFYIKPLTKGQRVKFAIKYLANSEEYWDNNLGIDYCLLYKT